MSIPHKLGGIGGSFANIIFQVGGVIGVAVQAGLLVTGDGTIQDWTGSKDSYFLTGAYVLVSGLIFGVWYRQEKMPTNAEAPGCGGVVVPRDQV